ncbi:MAG: hypothetical protein LWY06_04765 [Firmicutes bacterium]|nr:hypothetical protein [Bacillota bacterium]
MGIFKSNGFKIAIKILIVLLVAGGLGFLGWTYRETLVSYIPSSLMPKPEKPEKPPNEFGIVEYGKLIQEHPDFETLKKYDEEISKLGPNPFDPTALKGVSDQLSDKMMKFHKEMEKGLLAERDRIMGEAKGEVEKLQKEFMAKANVKKAEFESYQAKMRGEYEKAQKDPNRPLSKWEKEFSTRVYNESRDLQELKERQIAAKRLEIEKKSQEKLLVKKRDLEAQVASFEDALSKENNVKKVNLQLKMQAAKDDEERQQYQDELNKLYSDEDSKIAAKRDELRKDFDALDSSERAANEKALSAYRNKLERDVDRQLQGVKDRVASKMAGEGKKPGSQGEVAVHVPDQVRKQLEDKQKAISSEMQALEQQMKGKVGEIEARSKQKFDAVREKFSKKMEEYQKQLASEFERKKKELVDKQMEANKEKKESWEKLKDARQRKYNEIIADINRQVETIAKDNNVTVVVGAYTVNINGSDLNDQALEAVKKIKPQGASN